jgi:hypothetical protein
LKGAHFAAALMGRPHTSMHARPAAHHRRCQLRGTNCPHVAAERWSPSDSRAPVPPGASRACISDDDSALQRQKAGPMMTPPPALRRQLPSSQGPGPAYWIPPREGPSGATTWAPLFGLGHGLSYTSFSVAGAQVKCPPGTQFEALFCVQSQPLPSCCTALNCRFRLLLLQLTPTGLLQ